MRKLTLAVLLAAAPLMAFAEGDMIAVDSELGTTEEAVQAKLVEMGYEVRKMDMEGGMIEAYAVKGDQMLEVYVSPETGMVTKVGED
ncbi:PepSY domain-containing protein [Paracoccus tegillarcae]|uniref:PepSY domain-containing protein n=1 Tax=Paracoccus tegillarcae TaxID=1529068 RepID=A0A2K9EIM1_9RHOB|nr:PepSY domain-containing protein [Paracoccus tegillarcae]AUH34830.1 hypothetical protein CUV01_16885 [Paracoccus tegillarcae]